MTLPRPLWAALLVLLLAAPAWAKPTAPGILCQNYPDAPACAAGEPACTFCHTTPPARNAFGSELSKLLLPETPRPLSDEDFVMGLPQALKAAEALDSDGDGVTNLDELLAGSYPADQNSQPVGDQCPKEGDKNGGYDVCNYDPDYVFKKVKYDFCGAPTNFTELEAFRKNSDPKKAIHQALDSCLDSFNWQGRDGVLYRMAHKKILPTQSLKGGRDEGDVPLADYDDDYALFVYAHIDNRDIRELLTADYFVEIVSENPPMYQTFKRTPIEDYQARGEDSAQFVAIDRRVGMLTTRWFLMINTMFTPVPRTTAAQAYRAYLGYDIAFMEGLQEVPGEPVDYDQKGVQADACKDCHATLDPLSYPFTRYWGIDGDPIPYSYASDRLVQLSQSFQDPLRNTPEEGSIFGQKVANLLEWGQVAANSDAFARAIVLDYWQALMGEKPRPKEQAEFEKLWKNLKTTHQYGVERMLHELIDTEAYGVP